MASTGGAGNSSVVVAPHYSIIDDMRLNDIVVMPPWEGRNKKPNSQQWVRGSVRIKNPNGRISDLIVTGPKFRILYSGCNWNKICFADNDDNGVPAFSKLLRDLGRVVQEKIYSEPENFRPGSKNPSRFTFDLDLLKPSSDPSLYSDEIRTRLLTRRRVIESTNEEVDISAADLFTQDEDGNKILVEPCDIRSGGSMIPILKVSYYRNVERFGLVLTVLKGIYSPPPPREEDEMEWDFDIKN